ncbi:MATE family efflux transporter [Thermodesulfobacteriota bacterium]
MNRIIKRWKTEGGYREVLVLAIPLIISTGTVSVYYFVDRMFLAWYSAETLAASMPASMMAHTFMSFFMGIGGYASVFVAQYYGAARYNRVGPVIWQAIYISAAGGMLMICLIPFSKGIFSFFGHAPLIQHYEDIYFRILCLCGFPGIAVSAVSGYFSGRGKPWPVAWVNITGVIINLVLDYIFIFGKMGFPEMGIRGAGYATLIANISTLCIFFFLISRGSQNRVYYTLKGWRPDRELLFRMLRFGTPNGTQYFLEMAGFTIFLLILGRLGTVELVATNIAFNINTLAFMPMIGCGTAISVLVGQFLGKGRPGMAEKSSYSGFHLTFIYMLIISIAYVVIPDIFISPFALKADPGEFAEIRSLSIVLLRFVAVYSIFDTMSIIFSSAVKGAGDTKFVMYMSVIMAWLIMVIPSYIAIEILGWGVLSCWVFATLFVCVLGVGFYLRFLSGKWKSMLVIERTLPEN